MFRLSEINDIRSAGDPIGLDAAGAAATVAITRFWVRSMRNLQPERSVHGNNHGQDR